MAELTVDFDRVVGAIKPLHAGGQPNVSSTGYSDFHLLSDIGVPYSRLHDVGGRFAGGCYVDVPNLFRDFDADENDPANYDFTFTDRLLADLVRAGIEPYFRLGVTIENAVAVKAYRVQPPRDFQKWARICEHIMAHYLAGWADGYHYRITYWEIWNEPDCYSVRPEGDCNQMWTGTAEEYYRLYDVTAKHLKAKFPDVKIGGYASCGFYNLTTDWSKENPALHRAYDYFDRFFYGFFAYIKAHNSPIDFFSWHSYSNTHNTLIWADFLEKTLPRLGYAGLPTHLNEWNPYVGERGTAHHGAEIAGMMLGMQNKPAVALMCIYDMRAQGTYAALFDSMTDRPTYGWYALAAFNRLYRLGRQVALTCDTPELYAVAATDGRRRAMMISNLTGGWLPLTVKGVTFDEDTRFYIMDAGRLLSYVPSVNVLAPNAVALIEC